MASAPKKRPAKKKPAAAASLSPHALRVRARVAQLIELPRSVARRAAAKEALSPSQLQKAFVGFAKARDADLDALTPLAALELIRAFYTEVSFQGRAHGTGDMLLYQHATRGAETTVGFVRQLYARGRGQQLCVDLVYPVAKLRLPESVSVWSEKLASLEEWAGAVKEHLAAAEMVAAHPVVKVSLESF